jgi:hypothetical protein
MINQYYTVITLKIISHISSISLINGIKSNHLYHLAIHIQDWLVVSTPLKNNSQLGL